MKETLRTVLYKDLTYTEMRIVLLFMEREFSGVPFTNCYDVAESLGIDQNRSRMVCKSLKELKFLDVSENPEDKKKKYYKIALDEFKEEKRVFNNHKSNHIAPVVNVEKKDFSLDIIPEKEDSIVEIQSIEDPVQESVDSQMDLLRRAVDRRVKGLNESNIDPVEALKHAKENRDKHEHEEEPKQSIFSKEIRADNEELVQGMKDKYKRLRDVEDPEVICVLYALKFSYPDVTAKNIGQVNHRMMDAIRKCINELGFDETVSTLRGRRIAYNGTNFSKYWIRQFINMPKYRKERRA